jgi:hypothetical protein
MLRNRLWLGCNAAVNRRLIVAAPGASILTA